jgi:hypothetical protein
MSSACVRFSLVAAAFTTLFAVACSSSSDPSVGGTSADIVQSDGCKPSTELTCATGETTTRDGCTQPTAPAAASVPRLRCVPDCKPSTELTCAAGETTTTDGCTQPTAPSAASLPRLRCVPDCKPVTELSCGAGEVQTTDGCVQPKAPAAAALPKAYCVAGH